MGTKLFLDTNILLDLLDDKRPFHTDATELYTLIEGGDLKAFISESVLATADYLIQKIAPKEKRVSIWSELLDTAELLPCTTTTCRKAMQSGFSDLEDAILYQLARDHSIDYFISSDKVLRKHSKASLPVLSAKEFLTING